MKKIVVVTIFCLISILAYAEQNRFEESAARVCVQMAQDKNSLTKEDFLNPEIFYSKQIKKVNDYLDDYLNHKITAIDFREDMEDIQSLITIHENLMDIFNQLKDKGR